VPAFLRENVPFLRKQAEGNADPGTRSVALSVIAHIRTDNAQNLIFLRERAASDPDPQTRLAGLRAIGWSYRDDREALAFLIDRANNDPEWDNRSAIRQLLVELGHPEILNHPF
jgi:HEAT repeat protein